LLSGTPALSRPAELFTQIKMIDPKIFPFYKPYAIRYCEGRQGKYGFEAKGQSNSEELRAVMSKIMIRLEKD
jgi:SWI/SNF-related matrix-associated actin-dependent regulator 1 of chromatin subfamily A